MERFAGGQEIAVVEGKEVGAVIRKKREAAVQLGELVEVEGEEENAVEEAVLLRREAVVQHGAFVETGAER